MDGPETTPAPSISLLNVFEVDDGGTRRHLICFLDPTLAGIKGIETRAVVGEYTPGEGDEFDDASFQLNPEFVGSITGYMNQEAARVPGLIEEATHHPGGWVYILDPRATRREGDDPPAADLLGGFAVDDAGVIVPGSFQYNGNHVLFDSVSGVSAVLNDRRFYDWLHPDRPRTQGDDLAPG